MQNMWNFFVNISKDEESDLHRRTGISEKELIEVVRGKKFERKFSAEFRGKMVEEFNASPVAVRDFVLRVLQQLAQVSELEGNLQVIRRGMAMAG